MNHLVSIFLGSLLTFSAAGQSPSLASLGLQLPPQTNCTSVKNQAMSGTCWSFASLSFIESETKRRGLDDLDLSEMFVARYSYIRKVETHLKQEGKNFFTPGGQFHDVMWVFKKYGIMPDYVYSGLKDGNVFHDHAELDTAMKYYVAELLAHHVTTLQKQHYVYLDSLLDRHLGIVVSNFTYKNRNYSPKAFAKGVLEFDPDDYVEITSYTHHPFYTRYVVEDKYNWTGDLYYNVPVQDFIDITRHALKSGFTVCWDGDVTETGFEFSKGLAWSGYKGKDWQAERQRTLQDSSSTIDHVMHITGVTKDNKGRNWYCVKNSWGKGNPINGYLFMNEAYFNIKTTAIVVHKDAIPPAIRKRMGILL